MPKEKWLDGSRCSVSEFGVLTEALHIWRAGSRGVGLKVYIKERIYLCR